MGMEAIPWHSVTRLLDAYMCNGIWVCIYQYDEICTY